MIYAILALTIGSSCEHLPFPPGPVFDHVEDNQIINPIPPQRIFLPNPIVEVNRRQIVFWDWDTKAQEDIAVTYYSISNDCQIIRGNSVRGKYIIVRKEGIFRRFRYRYEFNTVLSEFDRERANFGAFNSKLRRWHPF